MCSLRQRGTDKGSSRQTSIDKGAPTKLATGCGATAPGGKHFIIMALLVRCPCMAWKMASPAAPLCALPRAPSSLAFFLLVGCCPPPHFELELCRSETPPRPVQVNLPLSCVRVTVVLLGHFFTPCLKGEQGDLFCLMGLWLPKFSLGFQWFCFFDVSRFFCHFLFKFNK